jgi:hypothetical protein
MFTKYIIDLKTNKYDDLSKLTDFEDITKGRQGANLVNVDLDHKKDLIPIIRTTTCYTKASQKFLPLHHEIIKNIKTTSNIKNLEFNNALIEIYDSDYTTMGFHSDQALDLADNSYICLFSCYNTESPKDKRKLIIKEKTEKIQETKSSEIILDHNSIVLFSTEINKKWLHKIILEKKTNNNDKWLGITWRLSKTYIKFTNNVPYTFPDNKIFKLADNNEKKEFYKYKKLENDDINYKYPQLNYSISPSDIMPIN